MTALYVTLAVFLYMVIGGVTLHVAEETFELPPGEALGLGIFWPLTVPMCFLGAIMLGSSELTGMGIKGVKRLRKRRKARLPEAKAVERL